MEIEGFLSHINKTDSCWLWTGGITSHGYGELSFGERKNIHAHQISYMIFRGPVPKGLFVLHTCDVRNCVNPDHLYIGTAKDNMRDAMRRHRNPSGQKHGSAKLTWRDVDEIRKSKKSTRVLGKQYGVHSTTISAVKRREYWNDERRE